MGAHQHIDWADAAVSVLDWWRDAGVDVLVDDAPRDWLGRTPPPVQPAVTAPAAKAELPDTLDAFVAWRSGADAPGGPGGIVAEGDPAARLMIVTDHPDDDGLMTGAPGRLFDRMLAAIGLTRESVYLAPLSTTRPLGGRIAPEAVPRLAELLRHHIALVAPEQLLILGQAPSRALTGMDAAPPGRNSHAVNLNTGTIATVTSLHPRFLVERPAMKAQAWRDLQVVMGGLR